MQSKGAKIGFIVLLVVFGAGVFWMFNYGPFAEQRKEYQEYYKDFIKAEATIIGTETMGSARKSLTTWTVQFTDNTGVIRTANTHQDTFFGKDKSDTIIIYYNPENPNEITGEETYNDVMK